MNINEYLKTEQVIKGLAISPGISTGRAYVLVKSEENNFARKLNYEEISDEIDRFYHALDNAKKKVVEMKENLNENLDMETLQIFDAQSALLTDPLFIGEIVDNIKLKKVNAEYSIKVTANNWKIKLSKIRNLYISERANDIYEAAHLIIDGLAELGSGEDFCLLDPVIIVAEFLTLTDLARLDKEKVLGFVISRSGYTSHAAIVARSLNIPAVSMVTDAHNRIKSNDLLILDGLRGYCIFSPSNKIRKIYEEEYKLFQHRLKLLDKLNECKPISKDGVKIGIQANIEIVEELPLVKKYKAEGIGLFRTEFLVDTSAAFPTEKKQFNYYRKVLSANENLPVTVRTFDVGGDKMINEIELRKEDNPFLGWRAIRFQLANESLLRIQLKAALKANCSGNLSILIPMITNIDEIKRIKEILKDLEEELIDEGLELQKYRFGIMIEIPSAVLLADKMAKYVDFFSVGTNDLIQYTLAVDRGNEKVSYLYSGLEPSVLKVLKLLADNVENKDVEVSVCGEMASNPIEFIVLLILGMRIFSMVPWKIPVIKKLISSMELKNIAAHLPLIMELESSLDVREYIVNSFKDELSSIKDFVF